MLQSLGDLITDHRVKKGNTLLVHVNKLNMYVFANTSYGQNRCDIDIKS